MRNRRGSILRLAAGVLLAVAPLALEVGGCHGGLRPVEWSELGSENRARQQSRGQESDGLRIVPRSGREVIRLGPNDVIRIMQRVGFSDQQIIELGSDLHNALLLSGGAEVVYGRDTEMVFAVHNQQVQVLSRTRGSFVYDVQAGRFVLGPSDLRR